MENPSRPVTGYPAPNPNGHPAHPYPAPPPPLSQPYHYPPYYQSAAPPPYPNPRRSFLRTILVVTVAFFVIFGSVLLIFWLVVRPHLPEFQLSSLSVSNFSANQSRVTATWDARYHVYNPNKKMTVSYYDVVSYILFKSDLLTSTHIAPFKQDTRNQTDLTAKFSIIDSYVDAKLVNDLNSERTHGSVTFNVRLEAIAGFRYGAWRARRRLIRVWCNGVPVNVSSSSGGSGNLVGGPRNCKVGM
ncbi:hypothetical protein LWI28_013561 [Acer negundo]|uniref:Late embryogenesis abundant protein LEA-2 subgroup domain-containing protein n=1 Tax=Acer negundo TaxID=4023 RepID=A0AAD5JE84_ACENE|nr:hypothetical protein LWI28_013561 [Acer negundo]KAK4856027.1 hypothetical protein QYF36_013366 [Acer negundo]